MSEFVLLYRDTVDARKKMPIPCEDSDGQRHDSRLYPRLVSYGQRSRVSLPLAEVSLNIDFA